MCLCVHPQGAFTPLLLAIKYGNIDLAELLLENGADINQVVDHKGPAVLFAAMEGKEDFVKLLLDRGADTRKAEGLLYYAAREGNFGLVEQLLKEGANVNVSGAGTCAVVCMRVCMHVGALMCVGVCVDVCMRARACVCLSGARGEEVGVGSGRGREGAGVISNIMYATARHSCFG